MIGKILLCFWGVLSLSMFAYLLTEDFGLALQVPSIVLTLLGLAGVILFFLKTRLDGDMD